MNRVICSHERMCGCVHDVKEKKNGVVYKVGEPVVELAAMKNCASTVKGTMGDKYCCLTRERVHLIK